MVLPKSMILINLLINGIVSLKLYSIFKDIPVIRLKS